MRTLVLLGLLAACSREPSSSPPPPRPSAPPASAPAAVVPAAAPPASPVERARVAVAGYKRELLAALTAAKRDGLPAAIEACATAAPSLAKAASVDGLTVGRATNKPRNPANAAAGWQAEALASFEAKVAAGAALEGASWTATGPDGATRYAEPLVIGAPCVTCHGAELMPDVKAALAARYPDDRATGYALGDLRGLAWAEVRAR